MRRARQREVRRQQRRTQQRQRTATRAGLAAGAALGASVLFAPSAQAATIPVNSAADPGDGTCDATQCTLREAVAEANATPEADTVTFDLPSGTQITLTQGEIAITESITITGPGAGQLSISGDADGDDEPDFATTFEDPGDSRIFSIDSEGGEELLQASISGLTLTEGVASVYRCEEVYNYETYSYEEVCGLDQASGGAINVGSGPFGNNAVDLSISGAVITGNVATGSGGGVYQSYRSNAALTIDATVFSANQAGAGPTTLLGNGGSGGGLFARVPNATITASEFSGNQVASEGTGGGIFIFIRAGEATIDSATITGNAVLGQSGVGGGIYAGRYDAARYDPDGADSGVTISNSTITDNSSNDDGGGAFLSSTTLETSTVSGNESLNAGGVFLLGRGRLERSTVAGNTASGDGGGVIGSRGSTVSGSTISGNTAANRGGGIFSRAYEDSPIPRVRNSTITGNTAAAGGGIFGYFIRLDSTEGGDGPDPYDRVGDLRSTIVAGNTAGSDPSDLAVDTNSYSSEDPELRVVAPDAAPFEAGFSLIEAPGEGSLVSDPEGSNVIGVDPLLGPLADNGGPTQTHLPANTSAAIDAGRANGLLIDQRGLARTVDALAPNEPLSDATDMGSVELQDATAPGDDPAGTAPETQIDSGPSGGHDSRTATFTFSSPGTPSATFECSLDNAAFVECESPKTYTGLDEGQHTFAVRAVVGSSSDATPATRTFTVDVPGPPPPAGSCAGETATRTGTSGRDVLRGTPGRDVFAGGGGEDTIRGFGGNDLICAGDGVDFVKGGAGEDTVIGGEGNDRLVGDLGADVIRSGPGIDNVVGARGEDELSGNGGRDRLIGSLGNDTLRGGRGPDILNGGLGNDRLTGGPGRDRLDGGPGDDSEVQ